MTKRYRGSFRQIADDMRRLLEAGEVPESDRPAVEKQLADMDARTAEDVAIFDYFLEHMPDNDEDLTLIILKGHLLVEQKAKEFVDARLLTPLALRKTRLTSFQLLCLAEAMCLPNPEPAELWATARELNALRNDLVHELAPAGIRKRADQFLASYRERYGPVANLVGAIGSLYTQAAELVRMANTPEARRTK